MKQLIKSAIDLVLETFVVLCKGYFCLFLLGSVLNALNDTYVLRLTLCALAILIISNKIKDKVAKWYY